MYRAEYILAKPTSLDPDTAVQGVLQYLGCSYDCCFQGRRLVRTIIRNLFLFDFEEYFQKSTTNTSSNIAALAGNKSAITSFINSACAATMCNWMSAY